MTYFLGVCIGEGDVEMDILSHIVSKFVSSRTGGSQSNVDRCRQGRGRSEITENIRTSFMDGPKISLQYLPVAFSMKSFDIRSIISTTAQYPSSFI